MKVEGLESFTRASRALHELSDREIRLATYRGLRKAGPPLGEEIVAGGADVMPHHGGLAALVARTQVSVAGESSGKTVRVELRFQGPVRVEPLDDGEVHHPVFASSGRPRVWVTQRVTAGAFRRPFENGQEKVSRAVATEIRKAVRSAAGKV